MIQDGTKADGDDDTQHEEEGYEEEVGRKGGKEESILIINVKTGKKIQTGSVGRGRAWKPLERVSFDPLTGTQQTSNTNELQQECHVTSRLNTCYLPR
jgi:hypothetical protein